MPQTKPAPRIAITYCSMCNWMLRSAWLGQELLSTDDLLTEATGRPLDASVFKAHLRRRYIDQV